MISDSPSVPAASPTSTTVGSEAVDTSSKYSSLILGITPDSAGQPKPKTIDVDVRTGAPFPPPKTDKPRPHVCGTCGRSFARLEHLKRHERSHTKEKPFECPECTRCFARRDLLLRHQQKLHMTTTPSSRPRSGRRESTSSGTATGRVRKNSTVSNAAGLNASAPVRPRANTISHVDASSLGMFAAANAAAARQANSFNLNHGHQPAMNGFPGPAAFGYRGMSTATGHHGNLNGLPKLETSCLHINVGGGLRTAPPFQAFNHDFGLEYRPGSSTSTINPAQLHYSDSPQSFSFEPPMSPFQHAFNGINHAQDYLHPEANLEWINGFDHQMSFDHNEHAIDESSPSAVSTGSPEAMSEVMLDGSMTQSQLQDTMQSSIYPHIHGEGFDSGMDLQNYTMSNPVPQVPYPMPSQMDVPNPLLNFGPSGVQEQFFHPPIRACADTRTNSAASVTSSNRQSSVTSVSTDSITDATRQALLVSLSQPPLSGHNQRKYSQPAISSPLSPGFSARPSNSSKISLPSTQDLQRYVSAYIRYFHPHLPFLHIPSLSFDSPGYATQLRFPNSQHVMQPSGVAGGGGCLILAMAAIGALYEYESEASKGLFDMAKRMTRMYLEERRKADVSAAIGGIPGHVETSAGNTPLWLVQVMLLNAIYGHNCGDKISAEIARTSCAALVSLARAADLTRAQEPMSHGMMPQHADDGWNPRGVSDDQGEWHTWIYAEERKRTFYAVFVLSSMLVSAYNHAPALVNSEIQLELPCEEELWAAESPDAWYALGGGVGARQRAVSFASALTTLLSASQRQQARNHHASQTYCQRNDMGLPTVEPPPTDLAPSTFGCLVLINSLHNYIWETRQRHGGRVWSSPETEAMHAHIEPALAAWHAAWSNNPRHSLERPNPYGYGPLSANCIPLLDLAYVRLFINLGRSKEAFWQWDFDAMSEELANGAGIIQPGHDTEIPSVKIKSESQGTQIDNCLVTVEENIAEDVQAAQSPGQTSKRERHLRKAAFQAAQSLWLGDKQGTSFADFNSREMPMSAALNTFDCAQVVAEWITTVQERVGRFLGILGKDKIDLTRVPAIMLLEDEDCKLMEKIDAILLGAQMKMSINLDQNGMIVSPRLSSAAECGYGTKILLVTAAMMERAAVWPGRSSAYQEVSVICKLMEVVTRLMARSLETQATHMRARADKSLISPD